MSLQNLSKFNHIKKIAFLLVFLCLITGCSTFFNKEKKAENETETVVKKKRINPNAEERTKEARDRGLTIFGKKVGEGGGIVSFATSNVLWRASLEVLDFMPLASVDYAGGIISTDWYKKNISDKEEIKIRIQFVSDELSPSSIKVFSHKRTCLDIGNCKILKTNEKVIKKIKNSIINKAREIKIADEQKSKK